MGGLIILSIICASLLIRNLILNRRIRKLAELVDDFNSGTGEMLDVALEEDVLAQLRLDHFRDPGICDECLILFFRQRAYFIPALEWF